MKIEHFAYQVKDAAAVSDWYCEHLGFQVKRGAEKPFPVYFLADSAGDVMIEIYSNPSVRTPDYASMDPLILHLAFVCDEIPETIQRLEAAGATRISGPDQTPSGDVLAMLRDPWGLAIQLCHRAASMIQV
ncbi:VOC family protein [Pontiella agarivorans]|uniref:VOC family protein n=1 Tax=Pontiella agarivorans TaxID=3038953 RepID=A0ABU5MYB8_9BACT|nr:VOC family protein [Pontiella agarivorans]MDZ8119173.1 VOC family protein [Pontiella agarivorans]